MQGSGPKTTASHPKGYGAFLMQREKGELISNGIFQRPRRDVLGMLGCGGAEILSKSDKKCCEEWVYEIRGAMRRNIRHEQSGNPEWV